MTLPDIDENEEEQNPHNQAVIQALMEVVKQAVEEGRIICGVDHCVQLLKSCPGEILLCLLAQPTPSSDPGLQIQHVLIRAFCHENAIHLLKVQDQVKLTQMILTSMTLQSGQGKGHVVKPPLQENSSGFSCVMIKCPSKHDTSHHDDAVTDYVKQQIYMKTEPLVSLPS